MAHLSRHSRSLPASVWPVCLVCVFFSPLHASVRPLHVTCISSSCPLHVLSMSLHVKFSAYSRVFSLSSLCPLFSRLVKSEAWLLQHALYTNDVWDVCIDQIKTLTSSNVPDSVSHRVWQHEILWVSMRIYQLPQDFILLTRSFSRLTQESVGYHKNLLGTMRFCRLPCDFFRLTRYFVSYHEILLVTTRFYRLCCPAYC